MGTALMAPKDKQENLPGEQAVLWSYSSFEADACICEAFVKTF